VDAPAGFLRDPLKVGDPAVDGRAVELEVARVQEDPGREVDGQRAAVRDGMGYTVESNGERPGLDLLAGLHGPVVGPVADPVLLELSLEQPQGQLRPVDREGELAKEIGD